MASSILIGVDGSPHSEAAVELGLQWAGEYKCRLTGVGVVDEPGMTSGEMVPVGGGTYKADRDRARIRRASAQAAKWLDAFSARCNAAGVTASAVMESGDPVAVLSIEAQRHDLVLLGRQTHFRFESQDSPDDVLQQLIRQAPRPVVAVPLKPEGGRGIVIAYDGSLQAARAVQAFQATGLGVGIPVHVVHIGNSSGAGSPHACRAVEFLTAHGIAASIHNERAADSVANALVGACRDLRAGLVVMGAYGRSTLYEFFLGSVTRTMLAESPVPLFLYH